MLLIAMAENKSKNVLAGLLTGLATGVILGIIYAPYKGRESRKMIKTKTNELKDQSKTKYQDVSIKVKHQYEAISANLDNIKNNYDLYKDKLVSITTEVIKDVETELNQLK